MNEASPPSRRRAPRAAIVVGVAVLVLPLAVYATRKMIAREALTGWLRAHGVAAQVDVTGLGLGTFSGRVRVGDPRRPDFVVGDAAMTYGLHGLGLELRSITLSRPMLRARLHDGALSLGSLDPLVDDFRKKPPSAGTRKPRIRIEDGVLLLATDYGPVRLTADATVQDGRLVSMAARSAPSRLRGDAFDLALGAGAASLATKGERVALALDAPVESLRAGRLTATHARLLLTGASPYPDLKRKCLDGAVVLQASLAGDGLALSGVRLKAPVISARFQGKGRGGLGDFSLSGAAGADLRAADAALGEAQFGSMRVSASASDLRWTRMGGDALSATPRATALLQAASAGDLRLDRLQAEGGGPVSYAPRGVRAAITASLTGHGGWRGLGGVKAADVRQMAALKRAVQGFDIAAPAITLKLDGRGAPRMFLPGALQVRADRGGVLSVSGRGGAPVIGPGGGAMRLALKGADLPKVDADLVRLTFDRGGVSARGEVRAAGAMGPVRGATFDAAGTLRVAGGAATFTADRCAPVSADEVDFGVNDIRRLSVQLCPAGGAMFTLAAGDWRLRARGAGLAAEAPFLQARIAGGAGVVGAGQAHGRLAVTAAFGEAKVFDTAPQTRFNPVQLSGAAKLADAHWTADLAFSTPAGVRVADAKLMDDVAAGTGGVTFETGPLVFAEGGLQPAQLSPLAQALGAPVVGGARFAGRLDWTARGATSGGVLTISGLDFQTPAGKLSGLRGAVAFASLSPLIAAPGQILRADRLDAVVPVTGMTADFGLDEQALTLRSGEAAMEGGTVRLETLRLPLAQGAALSGVAVFEGVQLHNIIEASPFGDRVDLDATVSGRAPFTSQAGKVRVAGAELHAIRPGRLSIRREALTGVAASGSLSTSTGVAAEVPANDTFTDFAYQAMENLAFDKLEAAIASRDDGRLGILAHIVGRHDPPKRQEIRLSLFDLIGRKFLSRPLPLPSDTGVDLTLDTTLNLDDLLADYADYERLRSSPPVQSPAATTETKPLETPR